MAAETITPVCEMTGLPLPILPEELREDGALLSLRPPDRHHAFHRESHPYLQDIGGIALRKSRIQRVPYGVHHLGYHRIFDGPALPYQEDEKFRLTVIAAAGVLPRKALKITDDSEWVEVDLNNRQHQKIAAATRVESKQEVSKFISHFATKKGLEHIIDQFNIDAFLSRKTENETKMKMAQSMLSIALCDSVNGVQLHDKHRVYKNEGLIPEDRTFTFHEVAREMVKAYAFGYFRNNVTKQLNALQTGVTTVQ